MGQLKSWFLTHKLWLVLATAGIIVLVFGSFNFIKGINQKTNQNQAISSNVRPASPTPSLVSQSPDPSPLTAKPTESIKPAMTPERSVPSDGTCSPRGTATCDGEGRTISPGNKPISGEAGLASGVIKLNDIGLQKIALSSGGTNGLDIDLNTGLVYAVNNSTVGDWCGKKIEKRSDSLHIIDPEKTKEIAAIATDKGPVWPLVDTANGNVYVATSSEGIVARHRIGSGEKLGTIKVGGLPHDLGFDPASNLLFVSNTNDGSQKYIAVVNTSTQQVVAQHQVAALPHRIMLDAGRRIAYVVSVGSGTVSVFNTANGEPIGQIETGGKGTLAYSASKRRLFVPDSTTPGQPEAIRVIDADSKQTVGTIGPFLSSAGHQAFGLTVDEKNGLLFASIGDSSYVGIADINTLKPLAVFDANDCTWGIKLDEGRQRGFVTNAITGNVTMFDLAKIASSLKR